MALAEHATGLAQCAEAAAQEAAEAAERAASLTASAQRCAQAVAAQEPAMPLPEQEAAP